MSNNDMMKAISFSHPSKPLDIKISETSKPVMKDDEILIKVRAFGLNFADTMARTGNYADAPPFPFIPGYEISGEIIDIGLESSNHVNFKKGDYVIAFTRFGGYAEFAVAKYFAVFLKPNDLSFEDAASIPVIYLIFIISPSSLFNFTLLRSILSLLIIVYLILAL